MLELVLVAVALAMDAVAAATGLGASQRSVRTVVLAAVLFGLFQGGMAGLGWWGGVAIASWAAAWDHWIAFFLLGAIGVHMLWEARTDGPDHEGEALGTGLLPLLGLAVATSIDALAAGLTLPSLGVSGPVSIGIIGAVTAGLSLLGGLVGHRLGDRLGSRLEVVGALVLIGIGTKILIEHLLGGV